MLMMAVAVSCRPHKITAALLTCCMGTEQGQTSSHAGSSQVRQHLGQVGIQLGSLRFNRLDIPKQSDASQAAVADLCCCLQQCLQIKIAEADTYHRRQPCKYDAIQANCKISSTRVWVVAVSINAAQESWVLPTNINTQCLVDCRAMVRQHGYGRQIAW